ncbi:MAG: serine/threonine protein kinase, partial [Deltaproteobacteria bacterium]|nr:serine/threonine protein kinase [Deltaproteobacteria bacterium]
PDECWALLSDTDRVNRVAGLEMRFAERALETGHVEVEGRARSLGVPLRWKEIPYEWQANERYSVRREFRGGPASAYTVHVALTSTEEGTQIDYAVEVEPRSTLTRPLVKLDLAAVTRPALERMLRRAVATLDGTVGAFDLPPPPLDDAGSKRLERGLAALDDAELAGLIGTFLREAPLVEQQEIAPLRLARRWRVDANRLLEAMLRLVPAGVVELRWSLRCPSCRVGKHSSPKLGAGPMLVHCPSCNIPYDGSLPDALIASFRPHPAVRTIDMPIRCVGSPARTPHILAAANLEAEAETTLVSNLLPGRYRLRTLPDRGTASLQVRADRLESRIDIDIGSNALSPPLLRAASGRLEVDVRNRSGEAVRLLLERNDLEPDLCTVGRLLELPGADRLLPAELLAADLDVSATTGVVLAARVGSGGEQAVEALHDALAAYEPDVLTARGDVVMASFGSARRAVEAAALVEGALHVGTGVAVGAMLRLRQGSQAIPVGGAADRALAAAGDRGLLRSERVDVEAAAMVEALEQPGVRRIDGRDVVELRIEAPLRSTPPLRAAPPAPPPQVGDLLAGRFRILGVLATGGFGAALEATDRRTGDPVVVKVLHHELASEVTHLQRFYNEGRLASRIQSPHVAQVIDYGVDDEGRVWMASERLYGKELAAIIKRKRRLDAWLAVHLGYDVACGLRDAHAVGLVHRDIKPANIFICDVEGGRPQARLIDFGIAKAGEEALSLLRRDDTLVGTPHYMAPEQARAQPVDGRADLYALGVVLFEMLTGRIPFEGRTGIELLFARLQAPPLPISAFCRPEALPPGLASLIMDGLLTSTPEQRIPTASAVAERLGAIAAQMGERKPWLQRLEEEFAPTADADQLAIAAGEAGIGPSSPAHTEARRIHDEATSAPTWPSSDPAAVFPPTPATVDDPEDEEVPQDDRVTRSLAASWMRTTSGEADTEPEL